MSSCGKKSFRSSLKSQFDLTLMGSKSLDERVAGDGLQKCNCSSVEAKKSPPAMGCAGEDKGREGGWCRGSSNARREKHLRKTTSPLWP